MLVPTVRTKITVDEYARAVVRAWNQVESGLPSERAVGVLWAQYMTETGGRACWNWNIGNVKHVAGDGFDHCVLAGVWEGVSPAEAKRLVGAGLAQMDDNASHAKAVGPNRVSVVLTKDNPGSWFRAYPSLDVAMRHHLQLLAKKRYASAWRHVVAGDPLAFARELAAKGYFTATAEAYAAIMRPALEAFVRTTAYEQAVAELEPPSDALFRAVVAAPHGLNLRARPTVEAPRVAHLGTGTVVHVVSREPGAKLEASSPSEGGWSEVVLGAARGYVVSEWLVRLGEAPALKDMVEIVHEGVTWLVAPMQLAPMKIGQAREVVASMGCELPTPGLVDAIWRAADVRIDPATMIRAHDGTPATMDSPDVHREQAAAVERALAGRENVRLVAGAYKDVVHVDGKLGLYGWNVDDVATFDATLKARGMSVPTHAAATPTGGRVVQPPFFGHGLEWGDYSQGARPVRRLVTRS